MSLVHSCANCDTSITPAQRFCAQCGQRTGRERLTMHDIGHDALHALVHVDHSIFALIKALAIHPGRVAREYIEGKRKKHFGPFAFLAIAVGLASFMVVLTGVHWFSPVTDSGAAGFLQRHFNLVILMQMPILAGICALLFWKNRFNYAEHLVLSAYTSGFRILVLALVATPAIYFAQVTPANPVFVPLYYGLWLVYFSIAAAQFYRGRTIWVVARAILAGIIGQACTMAIILAFIVLFEIFRTH